MQPPVPSAQVVQPIQISWEHAHANAVLKELVFRPIVACWEDGRVGASALAERLSSGKWLGDIKRSEHSAMTHGLKWELQLRAKEPVRMDVTIYDGSPNTGMEGLADRFRRSVSALFACFALDCRPSFEEIGDLIKRYANVADLDLNLLPVVLVGLKADLPESDRQVTRAEAEAKASEFDCPYVEVSSLTGVGLNEAVVELLTRELHSRAQREEARNAYRKAHRRACATM